MLCAGIIAVNITTNYLQQWLDLVSDHKREEIIIKGSGDDTPHLKEGEAIFYTK